MCTCKDDSPFLDDEFNYNFRTNSFGGIDELIPETAYRSALDKAQIFCDVTGLAMGAKGLDFEVVVDGIKYLKASRLAQVVGHVEVVKMKLAAGMPCVKSGYSGLDNLSEFDVGTMNQGLSHPLEFAARLSNVADVLNELGSLGWSHSR